jgi:acetyl esterase/lipase
MSQPPVLTGVTSRFDERYDMSDPDALLDVFYPSHFESATRLPTIVWVHGGGFIAGSKDNITGYLQALAAKNFAVVGVNYSLAPTRRYPTPVLQVNRALAFLSRNEPALHVDVTRLFLAGDSAGAQIAAQLAIVLSNPLYAKRMRVTPSIDRRQLRGVILDSGHYELRDSTHYETVIGWSYFGNKDFIYDSRLEEFSVIRNITADFPAMFITAGNADPLASQSRALAETATKLGISVDSLFFPDSYTPQLGHQYQFAYETEVGQLALARTAKFVAAQSH